MWMLYGSQCIAGGIRRYCRQTIIIYPKWGVMNIIFDVCLRQVCQYGTRFGKIDSPACRAYSQQYYEPIKIDVTYS